MSGANKKRRVDVEDGEPGASDHDGYSGASASGIQRKRLPGKTLPAERLLPQAPNVMQWSVIVQTPQTFTNMIMFLKSLHSEVTLFPTDRRRVLIGPDGNAVKDKQGKDVIVGFRGIAVDAMDQAKCLMTVARVADRVSMEPASALAEDLDRLPTSASPPEFSVTVETSTLHTMIRDVKGHESLALYSEIAGSDMSIATSDASSESLNQTIRTRMSPSDHLTIAVLRYKYELSVPLDRIKTFIRRATDLHAIQVTLSLRSVTPTMWVFIVEAEGEDGGMVRSLPIPHVNELPCGGRQSAASSSRGDADIEDEGVEGVNESENDAVAGGSTTARGKYEAERKRRLELYANEGDPTNNADMIGVMHAPNHAFLCATDDLPAAGASESIPVRLKDLLDLKLLYRGVFSTKYLSDMVKPLSGDSQLTLFLGAKDSVDADAPLVMRFDLGKPESYVAYILAPKIDDD